MTDLLSRIDAAPLTRRYWATFGLIVLQLVCEIFDFFVVGFLVSAVAPLWKLNFGQSSVMLLSAGVGAIFGAMAFGWLADRFGRKGVVVVSGILCCLCAGSLGFVPDGDWIAFSVLRFFVGVGYGGAGASQFALVSEYTPSARRTMVTSWMAVPAGLGVLLASLVVSGLYSRLGWRGTAELGFAPIVLALGLAFVAPESARWLLANGHVERARRAVASMLGIALDDVPAALAAPPPPRPPRIREVYSSPRRFWLVVLLQLGQGTTLTGVLLWGPTILAQLLGVSPRVAASYFVFVSLAGLAGRMVFAVVPQKIGRVKTGQIVSYAGAVALALAATLHGVKLGPAPLFFVFLLIGHFFYDGGFSNIVTYAAELYPVRLAGLGMGVSSAAGGAGKIMGPLVMGLIAGASNLVAPHAVQQAILPAFLFLAGCCLAVGLSYSFIGIETHKKPLALQ